MSFLDQNKIDRKAEELHRAQSGVITPRPRKSAPAGPFLPPRSLRSSRPLPSSLPPP